MSDHTNPPAGGHRPGAAGGPQGPYGGQQPQNPYSAPQGQQPGQPQYGQPGQPQYGQGQPGQPQYGQPGSQGQQPQYGQPGPQYQQSGQLWPQPGSPDYPQQGNGGGGQPPYGAPETMQWQPEPKKRGKLIPLIAGVAVVAVVAGGGVFAYARLTGGGQPAEVLPGNSMVYARIDLNPSAGQKIAAVRFMLKFPSAKEKMGLTSDQDDLRQKLFDLIKKDAGDDLSAVDFEKDVKPWLGDRAGVAGVPGKDGKPEPIVAVEVKNEDQATKGLDKLFANEKDKPVRAFKDGYVLLTDDQSVLDAAVAGDKDSSLAGNATFKKDMDALGEQGFVSLWADSKAIGLAAGKRLTDDQKTSLPEGSMAAALRFDASYVELKGIAHGDQSIKVGTADAGDQLGKLPDTTAGALALSNGADLVDTIWKQLEKSGGDLNLPELTKGFTDEYGLTLPDDLKPLLGKNLAIAIDKDTSAGPKVAARIKTDPAKAEVVVDKVLNLIHTRSTADIPLQKAKDADTLVIATDQEYADQVLKGGNLGQSDSFKQALPNTAGAVMAAYVDFGAIGSLDKEISSNKDFAALRSAGLSSRITGDGAGEFTLRVVAK